MLAKLKTKLNREASASRRDGAKVVSSGDDTGSALSEPQEPPENHVVTFSDGVKVLCDSPDAAVDICFIHGLTGNRESTWRAKGQDAPWPVLLLASMLSARILTYGYNAYFVRNGAAPSANRLLHHATNFLFDLTNDRTCSNRISRPLIVVAHSMGGLVCKQAILLSQHNPASYLHDMFDSLKGIIFMGTPHRGSWMANWAATPASALSVFRSINKTLLEILETDNQLLEAIQDQFSSMLRHQLEHGRAIEITCFFEELPMFRSMLVVPKESAVIEGYSQYSIHATHAGMVKFASAEDNGFKRVSGELRRWQVAVTEPKAKPKPRRKSRSPRQNKTSRSTVKVTNMVAGKHSTQVVGADCMNAEGITAGDRSVQILSPDPQKVLAACRAAYTDGSDSEALSEERESDQENEVIMVPASSSTSR